MSRFRNIVKGYFPYLMVGLVAALVGGLVVARLLVGQDMIAGNDPRTAAIQLRPGTESAPMSFADVAEKVAPAVVKIETVVQTSSGYDDNPFFNDPFFRQMIPDFPSGPRGGLGSGFLFDERGYILTNEHVIRGASKIMVTIKDYAQPLEANVVGADFGLDLAVIKVKLPAGKKVPTLVLGDSNGIRVGDWAVAVGDPYGQDWTVTAGIISAKGRPLSIDEDDGSGKVRQYRDLIQTDAAINPGNSGGPLVNLKGEVVGINAAINASAQGIGYAIPINTAKVVLKDLIEKGGVPHVWLGVSMQTITEDMASRYELPVNQGVIIVSVQPKSPAYKAGIRQYDVILEFNGVRVKNAEQLSELVQKTKIGQRVPVTMIRWGETRPVKVTVEMGTAPKE